MAVILFMDGWMDEWTVAQLRWHPFGGLSFPTFSWCWLESSSGKGLALGMMALETIATRSGLGQEPSVSPCPSKPSQARPGQARQSGCPCFSFIASMSANFPFCVRDAVVAVANNTCIPCYRPLQRRRLPRVKTHAAARVATGLDQPLDARGRP